MKRFCVASLALLSFVLVNAQSKVYFIEEISAESLVKIYKSLGREAKGRVAVKISTGEGGNPHYLRPPFLRNLVEEVNGTIVECCTAYGGTRQDPKKHWATIHEHGFDSLFAVDIMDEYGQMRIPVKDRKHIKYDIVGDHLGNYDFMINLAHFKGHTMGGYGGVLKNASIGVASTAGKWYIHSAGESSDHWITAKQDAFLESMAAAAQAVHEYFGHGQNIIYINVMNNMSVDCDCDGHPAKPMLKDMGILASTDPVALDQACLDKVFNHDGKPGDDNRPLIERISSRHGTHTVDYAEKIGLGSKKYKLITIK